MIILSLWMLCMLKSVSNFVVYPAIFFYGTINGRENDAFALHLEYVAHGEMAMVLEIFGVEGEGHEKEIAVQRLRDWWTYERLPADWEPTKRVGLIDTIIGSQKIKGYMMAIRQRQRQHL